MALTEEERKSVVKLTESVPVMFQRGYLEGRRYQQELIKKWLEEHLSERRPLPFPPDSEGLLYDQRYIRDEDVQAFKNLPIE